MNLKKKMGSVRSHAKVQIQTTKKLDRMFWLLLEQNQEVKNNIRTYKDRFHEINNGGTGTNATNGDASSTAASGTGTGHSSHHLNSANYLQRRQANTLRSSSGVASSPKTQVGSSHNVFNNNG